MSKFPLKNYIHPKYRLDIDGLRGLAVASVVLFHAFPKLLPGGFIGVDVFFVISGFLISSIIIQNLENQSFSFIDFYCRRIRRIFPALLVVLIFLYGCGWHSLSAFEFANLGKHIAAGATFASNFVLWQESGYFDVAAEAKPLLHLWSLGIEEQFYLVAPFIFWGSKKLKINLVVLVSCFIAISFAFNLYLAYTRLEADFYSPISRFWELLIGVLLGLLLLYKTGGIGNRFKNLFSLVGLLLLFLGFVWVSSTDIFPGWLALLPTLGAFLIIMAGNDAWINQKLLSTKPLVWIGLISYPLYLWHWAIFTIWRVNQVEEISVLVTIVLIFISTFLAWLTYQCIEKPIRKQRLRVVAPILFFLLMAVGFAGFNLYDREGYPYRKIVQEKFPYKVDKALCMQDCQQISIDEHHGRNMVFLWGDSHAGHLYAGLSSQVKINGFALYDASLSGCPPILNFEPRGDRSEVTIKNELCLRHNQEVFELIKKYHEATVVMAGNWNIYDGVNQIRKLSDDQIKSTIDSLKKSGIKNIYLIGNFPSYFIDQPKLAAGLFAINGDNRTYKRFNFSSKKADERVEKLAENSEIKFISPIRLLCNSEGCLLTPTNSALNPMAIDVDHLSKVGSNYFVDLAVDQGLLQLPKKRQ